MMAQANNALQTSGAVIEGASCAAHDVDSIPMMTAKAVRCPVCGRMSCWVEVPVRGFARVQTECRRCRAKFEVEVKGEARGE